MFLPYRNQNPPESFPYATVSLIVLNIVVYVFTSQMGLVIRPEVAHNFGASVGNFHWYQMFSSMFLHSGPIHIIGNMWFLYLFGFAVEGRMRTPKFLILYFLAGILGGVAHLLIAGQISPKIPAIGASGAIMGVMGGAMYLFPHSPVDVAWTFWWRFGTSEWKLWWVGCFYIAFDLLEAFLTTTLGVSGGVANLAHLGGVASGFLIPFCMGIQRDTEELSDAKSTLFMTNDVSLLSERELRDMYHVNPTRSDVALHFLNKTVFGNGPYRAEALKAFREQFAQIIVKEPIQIVCQVASGLLMSDPAALTVSEMGRMAARAEREGFFPNAIELHRRIVNDPRASKTDIEGSAFRIAMLMESAFQDFSQAKQWYEYILQTFPMSPIIGQVKARLQFIATRVP
jgi:membrane associated rhomboid family serine protease